MNISEQDMREVFAAMTEIQQKAVYALAGLALLENSNDILAHHGVLGMKWGVRRYQNYDGTYTKKGLERYRKAEENYKKAKAAQKAGNMSKSDVKAAKRNMSKAYDKLKRDNMADKGKALYARGKTITDNTNKAASIEAAIVAGSAIASSVLSKYGNSDLARIGGPALAIGGTAVNVILSVKTSSENKKLRAYYAH